MFMQTAKYHAVNTLLKNNIHEFPCTDSVLSEMISRHGFKIIPYNYPITSIDREDFKTLGILPIAERYPMFTYCGDDDKFVFYRANLSAESRTKMLAHELGHIELGHMGTQGVRCSSDFKDSSPQEKEADEFAIELLAPACVFSKAFRITPEKISHLTLLDDQFSESAYISAKAHTFDTAAEKQLYNNFTADKRKKFKNIFIAFLILIAFSSLLYGIPKALHKTFTKTSPTISSTSASEEVVITKTGKKYHYPNCRHVKKREVFTISLEEAIEQGYTPCKDCINSTTK